MNDSEYILINLYNAKLKYLVTFALSTTSDINPNKHLIIIAGDFNLFLISKFRCSGWKTTFKKKFS